MAASAMMRQYMGAMADNRLRSQMGQTAIAGAAPSDQPDMAAMMQDMTEQKAQRTIAGRGRKRKAKK